MILCLPYFSDIILELSYVLKRILRSLSVLHLLRGVNFEKFATIWITHLSRNMNRLVYFSLLNMVIVIETYNSKYVMNILSNINSTEKNLFKGHSQNCFYKYF